jgi:hypothetical protein
MAMATATAISGRAAGEASAVLAPSASFLPAPLRRAACSKVSLTMSISLKNLSRLLHPENKIIKSERVSLLPYRLPSISLGNFSFGLAPWKLSCGCGNKTIGQVWHMYTLCP